jgi:citrate synthase
MSEKSATLTIGDKSLTLPVRSGSIGPDVIDITKDRKSVV